MMLKYYIICLHNFTSVNLYIIFWYIPDKNAILCFVIHSKLNHASIYKLLHESVEIALYYSDDVTVGYEATYFQ